MDTNETTGPAEPVRRSRLNSGIVAAGAAFGLTLAGLGVAAAQTDSGSDTSTTTAAQAEEAPSTTAEQSESGSTTPPGEGGTTTPADPDAGREARPPRPQETELTGDVAERVKAAALAAVPGGSVLRVETDADGSPYEAHVRKADGTEVVVKVNESFEVTATEEGRTGGKRHGRRGPGGPGGGETALTGDVADRVTAAAQSAVPGGTVLRVETDADGSPYEAHVRKADGTEVEVKVNENFEVTSVEEHEMRGPRPMPESETD